MDKAPHTVSSVGLRINSATDCSQPRHRHEANDGLCEQPGRRAEHCGPTNLRMFTNAWTCDVTATGRLNMVNSS